MNDFNNRRADLEERIGELEEALAQVKAQLRAETEREQHAAIDNLESYLSELDNKHANLQDFWKILRQEIRDLFITGSKDAGKGT